MFKQLRRNIVISITASLVILMIVTLSAIYFFSSRQMMAENMTMLERYADIYSLDMQPGSDLPPAYPDLLENPVDAPDSFQLSTFYSVALSDDGSILATDKGRINLYTEESLNEIAQNILDTGRSSGKMDALIYLVTDKGDYTLVAFRDNTETDSSLHTLQVITFTAGIIAIAALFLIALWLSGRLVRPLEENDRRQKQFVSDAGHELKTPIAVIDANAELLTRKIGNDPWLDNIRFESDRMRVLITQLLDLSRAESVVPAMKDVDLSRLVMGQILPFESLAYENGLEIISDLEDGIHLQGNRTQLSQLASILLDNAIRHSKGADHIQVSLKKAHHQAVFTVINQGDPINEEDLPRLFERFYRSDPSRSDTGHYGLGLAIAKAITELHKGNISVSCQDHLITFTVKLPI